MIQVGDVIKRRIQIYDPERDNRGGKPAERTVEATVIYVHPKNGWMTLEYNLPGGNYRESEFLR